MSYVYGPPKPLGRLLDTPAVAGFSLACAGAGMLAIEVTVRGWLGFVTSPIDLIVALALLALSAWLSMWAFKHSDGWWRALAFAGIVVSMVALVVLLILLVLWVLDEEPDAFSGNSNRQRGRKRSSQRRRRSSW